MQLCFLFVSATPAVQPDMTWIPTCRPDQVMEEVSSCLRMLDEVYQVFGLTYKAALSTRPDSYLGTLEQWDTAESALTAALDQTGKEWEVSHPTRAPQSSGSVHD